MQWRHIYLLCIREEHLVEPNHFLLPMTSTHRIAHLIMENILCHRAQERLHVLCRLEPEVVIHHLIHDGPSSRHPELLLDSNDKNRIFRTDGSVHKFHRRFAHLEQPVAPSPGRMGR